MTTPLPSYLKPSTAVLCALFATQLARGVEVIDQENASLNVNGQMQLHGAIENIDDPYKDDTRVFLFLRQARLSVNGEFMNSKYEVEWMLGGEEVPENNSVMSLLDGYFDTPLTETLGVKIGQYKVPYGRERLLDSGNAFHVNRSVNNEFFNIGRDVGITLHQNGETVDGAIGIFTGGGINIPERYLPEDIGVPMVVTRVGINDGLDHDVFSPVGARSGSDRNGFAAYLNGMYNQDSRVGHSTPLNVKYYDKSLMLNSAWNPYISARNEKADYYQYGVDVAWKGGLTEDTALLLTAEGNVSHFSNDQGDIETSGVVVSANLVRDDWTAGIRYAYVEPDSKMAYTDDEGELFPITDEAIQELTASVVYFIPDTSIKVIASLTYWMDVPVAIEPKNGAYNLMLQPDQVSYAARGGIELQDNYMANLIVQYNF